MSIVALDPGISTGIAIYFDNKYTFKTIVNDLDVIYKFLIKENPEVIVYEAFKHRPRMDKAELYSAEVIGVVKLYAQQYRVPTDNYLPSQAKAFWDMSKIKRLRLWKPGRAYIHEMDALRVLLTYRMQNDEAFAADIPYTLIGKGEGWGEPRKSIVT